MTTRVILFAVFASLTCAQQYNPKLNVQVRPQSLPQFQPQQPLKYARILRQEQDTQFDGSFNYAYETEDGISSQVSGALKNPGQKNEAQIIQGSFSYTGDDGQVYTITYIADENGFQPQGAHVPTPPPVPAEIARALEYIRSLPPPEDKKF